MEALTTERRDTGRKRAFSGCARDARASSRVDKGMSGYFLSCSKGVKDPTLVVQWLRLQAPNAGGPGLIPGQGTRSHMPQLRAHILQLKISSVATKTWYSQISKYQNRTYSSASRSLAGERGHPWLEFPILTSTLRSGWLQDPSNQPRKRRNHIIQRQREVDC